MSCILLQVARSRRWGPRLTHTSRRQCEGRNLCSWWPDARRMSPRPRGRSYQQPNTSARSEPPGRTTSAPGLCHPLDHQLTSPATSRSRCVCRTEWSDSWSAPRVLPSSVSNTRRTLTSWLRRETRSQCSTSPVCRRVWKLLSVRSKHTSLSAQEVGPTLCSRTRSSLQTLALCSTLSTSPASAVCSHTWTRCLQTTCSRRPLWVEAQAAVLRPRAPQLPVAPG